MLTETQIQRIGQAVCSYCMGDTEPLSQLAAPGCLWFGAGAVQPEAVLRPPQKCFRPGEPVVECAPLGADTVLLWAVLPPLRVQLVWREENGAGAIAAGQFSLLPARSSLMVRTPEKTRVCLHWDDILWVESAGRHSLIHLKQETCTCTESVSALEQRCGGLLLRVHSSYLVNPAYVHAIMRFKLVMTDGAVIPVPEKKYCAVKRRLAERGFTSGASL